MPIARILPLRSPGALVAVLLVTSVLGFSSFFALLSEFQRDWRLTNAEAGWSAGLTPATRSRSPARSRRSG